MTTATNPSELVHNLVVLHKAKQQEWAEWHNLDNTLDEMKAWASAWDSSVEAEICALGRLKALMDDVGAVQVTYGPYRAVIEKHEGEPFIQLYEGTEKLTL